MTDTPMVNNGSSQKDNLKNTDHNNPTTVMDKSRRSSSTQYIELSDYSSEDVTAYVVFRMFKYKRRRQDSAVGFFEDEDSGNVSKRTHDTTDYKASIVLPLMVPVQHEYQVNWGSFDSLITQVGGGAMIAAGAGKVIEAGATIAAKRFGANGADVANRGQKSVDILSGIASKAANSGVLQQYTADTLANATGMAFNPDSELVLQGIALRRHAFEFTITPRNAKEKDMVIKAIKLFKEGMLPNKTNNTAGQLLNYPYEFTIHFIDGRRGKFGDPLGIPHIPDCALTNMAVVYNPQGNKFHEDGSPVQYRISVMFSEHTTLTAEDIVAGEY